MFVIIRPIIFNLVLIFCQPPTVAGCMSTKGDKETPGTTTTTTTTEITTTATMREAPTLNVTGKLNRCTSV